MVKTLKDQIEIDKSNEQVRKDLALRADYNLLGFYLIIFYLIL